MHTDGSALLLLVTLGLSRTPPASFLPDGASMERMMLTQAYSGVGWLQHLWLFFIPFFFLLTGKVHRAQFQPDEIEQEKNHNTSLNQGKKP